MTENADAAQARVFLTELEIHTRKLVRRRAAAGPREQQAVNAELDHVRRQIAGLRHRFPELG
ncbi:hypothetical protein [Nocardia sp. NPDC048505]|uniref:hypothetical protein n=1 Tax=unclassified Nocardia TaxID=2637762 RepID=UPI0033D20D35